MADRGGYRPAWISYDTIISELLSECNQSYIHHSPSLFDVASALRENLNPFFSQKDKEREKKLEKELVAIEGEREDIIKREYLSKKSDDANAADWNRNLMRVIDARTDENLNFDKGCAIWKFCLRSDAFKRATREKESWTGTASSSEYKNL